MMDPIVIGTMKIMVMAMAIKNGKAVASVMYSETGKPTQVVEYVIEGCADLGNQYVSREGMTSQWIRGSTRVADRLATQVCEKVEEAQQNG